MKERFSLDFSTSQGGYKEDDDFTREFDSRTVVILMNLTLETTGSGFVPPNTDTFLRHFHWAFCHCWASFSLMGKDGHIQKVVLTTQDQNCPLEMPVALRTSAHS